MYAGIDPVTRRQRYLKEICPDENAAAIALGELLKQAGAQRFPDRDATLGDALRKYVEVADLGVSTREAHEGYIRRTIGLSSATRSSASCVPNHWTRCTRP